MLRKIVGIYYYQKARNAASHEDYLSAIEFLDKIPKKNRKLFYYLLRAFILEQLKQYEDSLCHYDIAIGIINNLDKITKDEKEYLLKYANYGYSNIYRLLGKNEESIQFLSEAKKHLFDIKKIRKYFLSDFPLSES